ncbi:hypothetical protein [Sodalinema gerasimenkoae]|uniref:hypothetical protein n=1 Tax=Sodalinema gerasimenkoae TaxID=2862348 RepID=UPI001359EFF6
MSKAVLEGRGFRPKIFDKTQLISQLWGRLLSFVSPAAAERSDYRYFWENIPLLGQYLPNYSQTPAKKRGQLLFSPLFKGKQGESEPSRESKGELATATVPEIEQLLTQAKNYQGKPWFRPLTPSLTPPRRATDSHPLWA